MSVYLYYDVKGIQSFIFKIPKLKHIVGGSALIDQFDKKTVKNLDTRLVKHVFSGGGKGAFLCDSLEDLDRLKRELIDKARDIGIDIRFGVNEDFSEAAQHSDELYTFVPDLHGGEPCPDSGLYPVKPGAERHDIINKRLPNRNSDLFRWFENLLLPEISILGKSKDQFEFFHNVSADDEDGKNGASALGSRNRWAVIYMDGNDMGKQFQKQLRNKLPSSEMQSWLQNMSQALAQITVTAATEGTQRVVVEWAGSEEGKEAVTKDGMVTLPIRPLLVGGDDIIVLCHCSYALSFVKEVMRAFEVSSREKGYDHLWPATNGGLTISAGVLYAPVTLPLHTAIPYAENLLGSAKVKGREKAMPGEASPACIDWEQITETVIDTPRAKRSRGLIFKDEEIGKTITLTRRPYTMESFANLENLAESLGKDPEKKLPRTIRHKILPALRKGQAERLAFYARIKKNHPYLFNMLNELEIDKSSWHIDTTEGVQSIGLVDALMLLEENDRMEKGIAKCKD